MEHPFLKWLSDNWLIFGLIAGGAIAWYKTDKALEWKQVLFGKDGSLNYVPAKECEKKMGEVSSEVETCKPPCALHQSSMALVQAVKDVQAINVEKHKNHEREISEGKTSRDKIIGELAVLKEGVGILMDRTGGRPQHWKI